MYSNIVEFLISSRLNVKGKKDRIKSHLYSAGLTHRREFVEEVLVWTSYRLPHTWDKDLLLSVAWDEVLHFALLLEMQCK